MSLMLLTRLFVLAFSVTYLAQLNATNAIGAGRSGKLIRGSDAVAGEFPWIVSLYRLSRRTSDTFVHFCGSGAILNERSIVTVAHCVHDKDANDLRVLAGSLHSEPVNVSGRAQAYQILRVCRILLHPNYAVAKKYGPAANDIAILTLETPLEFNDHVKSIQVSESYDESSCCVTMGWGNTVPIASYSVPSIALQKVKTEVISSFYCFLAYPLLARELKNTICGTSGPLKGPCSGDSGNPLVCYEDGVPFLVGLGSWGWVICGDAFHPDVYTDIKLLSAFWNANYTINHSR